MRRGGWWTLSESLKKFFDKQMISFWILIFNLIFFSMFFKIQIYNVNKLVSGLMVI